MKNSITIIKEDGGGKHLKLMNYSETADKFQLLSLPGRKYFLIIIYKKLNNKLYQFIFRAQKLFVT